MHISMVKTRPPEPEKPTPLKMVFAWIIEDARKQSNPYLEDCLVPGGGE